MFMALKVACCVPVASSPEAWVSPAGDSEANPAEIPPLALKKLISVLATLRWLTLRSLLAPKFRSRLMIGVGRIVGHGRRRYCRARAPSKVPLTPLAACRIVYFFITVLPDVDRHADIAGDVGRAGHIAKVDVVELICTR